MGVSGWYLFRVGVIGAMMTVMVALSVSVAAAEEVPDASCRATMNATSAFGDQSSDTNVLVAVGFTAVNSGRLTTAEVPLTDYRDRGSLVMEIRTADGASGGPGATVLATEHVPASGIPDGETPTTVSGHFSPGAAVVAGQEYFLVLRSSDGHFGVGMNGTTDSNCLGRTYSSADGGAIFDHASWEMIFATFVELAPMATDNSYTAAWNTPLRVAAPGLLANDSDAAGDALTAAKVTDPAHGEAYVNADGSFAYFPDEGYLGTDSFVYRASDGAAGSDTATVTIRVKDATKPTISPTSPKPTSTIRDTTPTIRATVKDNTPLAKANIKLYVAGRLISATKYSYVPSTGALVHNSPKLSSGKKTVKIVATDAAGNAFTKSWYFTIR